MSVIYEIFNTISNKSYIGSSKHFQERKTRHLRDLRNNKHHNVYLQRSYNKYGESVFVFNILEECTEIDQFDRELHWINKHNPEYNIGSVGGGDNLTNNPRREEIINQIKATTLSNLSKLSEQERKDKWGRAGDANPNWKGGINTFTCPGCGYEAINQGQKTCSACRDRTKENNPFFGKTHSEDTKNKLSQLMKDRVAAGYLPPNSRKVSCEGVEFNSLSEAARQYNLTSGAIHYRLNSKAKKWKNYFYINA